MKSILAGVVATVAITFLSGCSGKVNVVKNGIMQAYPQSTIGDTFKANFDDGKWSSEKKDGKVIVKFTGKISEKLHKKVTGPETFSGLLGRGTMLDSEYVTRTDALRDSMLKDIEGQVPEAEEEVEKGRAEYQAISKEEDEKNQELFTKQNRVAGDEDKTTQVLAEIKQSKQHFSELKEQVEKKYEPASQKLADLRQKVEERRREHYEKEQELKTTFGKELVEKHWWPIGSDVEVQWVVYPDGDRFEVVSFANNSWNSFQIGINTIFTTLYKD